MRGRSYTPSPPRGGGYGRRGRSPSPRGRYGGGGGRGRDLPTSLLVRNLRHDCRPEDLRRPFEQFGALKDIYLPREYYSGEPRGFGFVQFVDPGDAAEAKRHMDGRVLLGRELTVVFAEENRKKPTDMRARDRGRGRFCRRSPPRYSRSPPSRYARSPFHSRDYSPPVKRGHYSRKYSRERSYSRSPAYNRSGGRSRTPERVQGQSRSPSRSQSRNQTPRRNRSPRWSQSQSQSRSQSPRCKEYLGEPNGDRSPSR